jgi:hypothetical protein
MSLSLSPPRKTTTGPCKVPPTRLAHPDIALNKKASRIASKVVNCDHTRVAHEAYAWDHIAGKYELQPSSVNVIARVPAE